MRSLRMLEPRLVPLPTLLLCPLALLQRSTGWLVAGSGTGPIWLWDLARCAIDADCAVIALLRELVSGGSFPDCLQTFFF